MNGIVDSDQLWSDRPASKKRQWMRYLEGEIVWKLEGLRKQSPPIRYICPHNGDLFSRDNWQANWYWLCVLYLSGEKGFFILVGAWFEIQWNEVTSGAKRERERGEWERDVTSFIDKKRERERLDNSRKTNPQSPFNFSVVFCPHPLSLSLSFFHSKSEHACTRPRK